MKPPTIKTKQFTLRPYSRGDEKSLALNINNEKITRNLLTVPCPYKLRDARQWINKNLKWQRMKRPLGVNFVIDINGEVAGCVGFDHIEEHQASVGYWLAEKYWGQGIITSAVKLVVKYGFDKMNFVRIYADVFPWNKASMRVLEKNGFKLEGILKKHVKKGEKLLDDYLFAKVK